MIDTHTHLNDSAFDSDRHEVLERARQIGVSTFVDVSEDINSCLKSLQLFEKERNVWCTAGLHPHRAKVLSSDEFLKYNELLKHEKIIAVGEIGLDYYYESQPREIQRQAFTQMLDLASREELPVIVHNRDSDEDLLSILNERKGNGITGVIHCFTGGSELALEVLNLGFYISFSGIVTFRTAEALRDVVREVPMDRLLFETDAPYLAPVPMRGKRNEPGFVIHTAQMIAEIKKIPMNDLVEKVMVNAEKLFKWKKIIG